MYYMQVLSVPLLCHEEIVIFTGHYAQVGHEAINVPSWVG